MICLIEDKTNKELMKLFKLLLVYPLLQLQESLLKKFSIKNNQFINNNSNSSIFNLKINHKIKINNNSNCNHINYLNNNNFLYSHLNNNNSKFNSNNLNNKFNRNKKMKKLKLDRIKKMICMQIMNGLIWLD